MTRRARGIRPAVLALTALAGLVASHAVDYVLLVPNGAERRTLLHQTGHGYFAEAVVLALAGAALAAASVAVAGYRRGQGHRGLRPTFVDWAWSLGWIQTVGFVALEFGERLAAHAGVHHFTDPTIYVGILIQILSACAGAALLVLLDRAAARVGRARSTFGPLPEADRRWPRPAAISPLPPRLAGPGRVRAPPPIAA